VIRVARRLLPGQLDDPRIHVIPTDARLHLRQTAQRYDVVIVDAPDPSTSQINRLYTREFFAAARAVLQPEGVLCFSLGQFEEYVGPELAILLATARRTLADVFAHVLLLPGGRVRFLGSDGPLSADIAGRLEAFAIPTRLVNRDYLKGELTADRLADLRRAAARPAEVNRDFSPSLYYHHLGYWMSQFRVRAGLLEAALLALLGVYVLRIGPVPRAIFASGLAASVLEVVLLVGFQILFGSLYHRVALVVLAFMTGLAAGSLLMNRLLPRCSGRHLAGLLVATAALAALLPAECLALDRIVDSSPGWWIGQAILPLTALLLAALVGMQFPLAGKLEYQAAATAAARLYTADYLGAALGALLVSTWLIPWVGVGAVCLGTSLLCLLAAAGLLPSMRTRS
jgi:spermidine synthase